MRYVIEFGKESVYAFRTAKVSDGRPAWEPPAILTEEGGTFLGVPVTVISEEESVKKGNSPRPEAYDLANLPNPPSGRPDPRDGLTATERRLLKKDEPVYLGPVAPKLSPLNALRRLDRYFAGADAEDVGEALEVLWEYVTTNARA